MSCKVKVLEYNAKEKRMKLNLSCSEESGNVTLFVDGKKKATYSCRSNMNISLHDIDNKDAVITTEFSHSKHDQKVFEKLSYSLPISDKMQSSDEISSSSALITMSELDTHMKTPNLANKLVILDVSRFEADHRAAHIPGARWVNWLTDLALPEALPVSTDPNYVYFYELPSQKQVQDLIRKVGIKSNSEVVIYSNMVNRLAIRCFFVLAYYGVQNLRLLDGGTLAWREHFGNVSGLSSLSSGQSLSYPHNGTFKISSQNLQMLCDKDYVQANLKNSDIALIDARPFSHWFGGVFNASGAFVQQFGALVHTGKPVARAGHISTALNRPWADNLGQFLVFADTCPSVSNDTNGQPVARPAADGNAFFAPLHTLYGLYRPFIEAGKSITLYCNEGIHAVFAWFVIVKMLSYSNVKVYEGSAGEWAVSKVSPAASTHSTPMTSGFEDPL